MKTLILAEKPSVASDIAKALGGFQRSAAGDWERADTIISNAIGHLAGIAAPEAIARQTPAIPKAFDVIALKKTETHLKHVVKLIHRKRSDNDAPPMNGASWRVAGRPSGNHVAHRSDEQPVGDRRSSLLTSHIRPA